MNVSISQAMACGLPVIATRHSGLPEQVADGITGLLIPENNWQALSDAIIYLIEHSELWASMGSAGHEQVKSLYNDNATIKQQIVIYEKLINSTVDVM